MGWLWFWVRVQRSNLGHELKSSPVLRDIKVTGVVDFGNDDGQLDENHIFVVKLINEKSQVTNINIQLESVKKQESDLVYKVSHQSSFYAL